jgi:hypothetical protein
LIAEFNEKMAGTRVFYRLIEDLVVDLLQDPRTIENINWRAKPLFSGNKRLLGPYSSGVNMEMLEKLHPGKTVINLICYSDEVEFYKGVTAHPIMGKIDAFDSCILNPFLLQ